MSIEAQVKEDMISLGTYKPEFDMTISLYAGLMEQYKALEKEFKKSKFSVVDKAITNDGVKRSPIVTTMTNLRKDILSYSNALGLTPLGLRKLKEKVEEKPKSKLERALMNFGT